MGYYQSPYRRFLVLSEYLGLSLDRRLRLTVLVGLSVSKHFLFHLHEQYSDTQVYLDLDYPTG